MPDMDGYEVLRRIRQHPPTANIPVIFLTALASLQDERLGRELGAEDYLTKPIDPDKVVARVEAHVKATAQARRMDALSEKLSRHMEPQVWEQLFHSDLREQISFEEKTFTVVHAGPADFAMLSDTGSAALATEAQWLATRHGGRTDRFVHGASVAFFEREADAVKMAADLQRLCAHLRLRVGMYTGPCELATFRSGNRIEWALIGPAISLAAAGDESGSFLQRAGTPYGTVQSCASTRSF
ncbi:MAG: response regulator, partial [Ramlibacter sp.]